MTGEAAYQSFRPSPLPPEPALHMDNDLIRLLISANRQLVYLDTSSKLIPNTELFVSMYVRKEALISSQIGGTQCTLDDVLDPESDNNANLDVSEVVNYVRASQFALKRLQSLPLCNRLLRETHAVLMEGVRGQEKNPGEFRRSQNWIGSANCTLKDARYIPPNVDDMTSATTDLERYINENDAYDPLIQIALIHYQFETIHPFLDGNGRIGRLLVLLYLIERKLLSKPVLYVSYFLKKIRSNTMTGSARYDAAEIMSNGYASFWRRLKPPQQTQSIPFLNYPPCMTSTLQSCRNQIEAEIVCELFSTIWNSIRLSISGVLPPH